MATTEERLTAFVESPVVPDVLEGTPLFEREPEAPIPTWIERLPDRISARFCDLMIVAWTAIFGAILALEPAPADPNASDPWYVALILLAFVAALITTYVGLFKRRRWGLAASGAASGLGVVLGIGCVVSGHHTGFYPFLETLGFVALGVLGTAGFSWLRARPSQPAGS